MGVAEAVWAYRGQNRIEEGWSRLKGKSLSLEPMYLREDERLTGMVLLLSVALRVLALVEWKVRSELKKRGEKLSREVCGSGGKADSDAKYGVAAEGDGGGEPDRRD